MPGQPTEDLSKYLACIHCGLCTSACPTYLELGSEADSPRGRIHLMRSLAEQRIDWTTDVVHHLELCLDCQACVTACPSGVEYGSLIEEAREHIEANGLRPWRDRLLIKLLRDGLFPYPKRMKAALFPLKLAARVPGLISLLARLPAGIGSMVRLVPANYLRGQRLPPAEDELDRQIEAGFVRAVGERRGAVGMLKGCVGSLLFADVNRATAYVLAVNGYDVVIPPDQGCCGSLHLHTGATATTRHLGAQLVAAFAANGLTDLEAIVVNAAGCGSAMKQYKDVFSGDEQASMFAEKVQDVTEFLASVTLRPMGEISGCVTYHDACHLLHGQGIRQQPRALLQQIPGLDIVILEESDVCCGSAGIYNIIQNDMGQRLSERKIDNVKASGAHIVATGNSGCAMQIAAGAAAIDLPLEVVHPIQLMYRAYRAKEAAVNQAGEHA